MSSENVKATATLAELVAAREARELDRAKTAKAAAEERAVQNELAILAAEQKHGEVGKTLATIDTDAGIIIVKRSNPLLFKRFQDGGQYTTDALEAPVRPCLVHPSPAAFDAIIEELPATLQRVASAVVKLAGVRDQEVAGK